MNTARVAGHGTQRSEVPLPKPHVETLTGTMATRCHSKIAYSHSWVHGCHQITQPNIRSLSQTSDHLAKHQITQPKRVSKGFLQGQLKHSPFLKTAQTSKEADGPVYKSGRGPTTLSSLQKGIPLKFQTNWLILEGKKTLKWRGDKVSSCGHGMTPPTVGSPSAPKCRFLASNARPQGCRFAEV